LHIFSIDNTLYALHVAGVVWYGT